MFTKDIRFFKENKDACDQKYPYERADKLTKTIRKLGLNDKVISSTRCCFIANYAHCTQGETFLDRFRILITEIGMHSQ